jgi:hypothetical protein
MNRLTNTTNEELRENRKDVKKRKVCKGSNE